MIFDPGKYLQCDNWRPRDFKERQTTPRSDFLFLFRVDKGLLLLHTEGLHYLKQQKRKISI